MEWRFDWHKIATRLQGKVDGPDDLQIETIIRQVMISTELLNMTLSSALDLFVEVGGGEFAQIYADRISTRGGVRLAGVKMRYHTST